MAVNAHWLLPDHANPSAVVGCDDPAESLARHGRMGGLLTLNLMEIEHGDDADVNAVFGAVIKDAARRAFRYAQAAMTLDEANHLAVVLGLRE
jgi:hypothetical protein